MSERDYYEVLGVDKGADEAKIKKAYKRLAMKYHPDRNGDDKAGAEKKFKEVRKAYDVISNPQKRSTYDQFGHAGVEQGAGGFGPGPSHLGRQRISPLARRIGALVPPTGFAPGRRLCHDRGLCLFAHRHRAVQ